MFYPGGEHARPQGRANREAGGAAGSGAGAHRAPEWWHRVRDGTLAPEDFEQRMKKVRRTVGRLLREAEVRAEKTAGMAREILQLEEALWTFVERIFTAVTTLKLQKRSVLDFLTDTLRAHRRGSQPPSLLPLAEAPQLAAAA